MKLLDPAMINRVSTIPAWTSFTNTLLRAIHAQAVTCPLTSLFEMESSLYSHGSKVHAVAQLLTDTKHIDNVSEIQQAETYLSAMAWAKGDTREVSPRSVANALRRGVHPWAHCVQFAVDRIAYINPRIIRSNRDLQQKRMQPLYDRWRASDPATREAVFQEEIRSAGPSVLKAYQLALQQTKLGLIDPSSSPSMLLMLATRKGLQDSGLVIHDISDACVQYWKSEYPQYTPTSVVQATLHSFQAVDIARGMKYPGVSDACDIQRIALGLPYGDFMLIEKYYASVIKRAIRFLPSWAADCQVFASPQLQECER